MASSKQLKISVDMAVNQPQYLVVDTGITSVLFDSTDDATEYAYSISGKKMTDQRDTEVEKVKQTDTEHSCDIPLKDRTALNREYKLTNYRGYILYVKFFKPNEYTPCARQILIVKPADLLISRVAFIDSKNNDLGPCSVQYQADLRFGMRMEFSRSLLRNEKVPTLICKVFYSDAITKEYKEVPDMGIDGKVSGNYIVYCNDGLPESLAGADFVFSFGFNEPYSSPFIDQKTNKLTPTIQKIHLLSREVKKPEINTVVWSSKEKITFGEKSSKRATICRNEDGFLHIHTYGMYGEHVRVEIFEKDSTFTKYLLLGTLEDVVIIDNTAYVPVEMSGVYSKADKMRSLEGNAFEIVARVTPLDTSISPGESEIIQLKIEKKPSEANPARCTVNGTQKFVIAEGEEKKNETKNKKCPHCKESAVDMQKRVQQCFPHANVEIVKKVTDAYCKYMHELQMDTCWLKAHFFAQIAIETGEDLKPKAESMNYTSAGLLTIFKNRFTEEERKNYGRTKTHKADQKMIAKIAYGGQYHNGSKETDDGWNYRGKGLIQLTFKSNYEALRSRILAKKLGDIVKNPDLLINNYEVATYASMLYLYDHGILQKDKKNNVLYANGQKNTVYICKLVGKEHATKNNTSTNYKDKQKFFDNKASKAFLIDQCEWKEQNNKISQPKTAPWLSVAFEEYKAYKQYTASDIELKNRIDTYCHIGKGKGFYTAWCAAFIHYCFIKTENYKDTNKQGYAVAFDWLDPQTAKTKRKDIDGWPNGEKCEAFVGAIIIFSFSHIAFIIGQTKDKQSYIYLGGNQGGTGPGKRKITLNKIRKNNGTFWIMKPIGYQPTEEEKKLPIIDITTNSNLNYESTH